MSKIRVLVADDHPVVRKGLCTVLDEDEGIEVIGEAGDGRQAVDLVGQLRPDVAVMDISMPVLGGLEATDQIKKRFPEVKVLLLTIHPIEEYVLQALRVGACGYIAKEAAVDELVSAVQAAHRGAPFICTLVPKEVLEEYIRTAKEDDETTGMGGQKSES